ncbi:MAG TPA: Tn3 family transposase [Pseudonocardiaceae bacterium]|nr:Tn3 family transposase [Pseudonocardiaceae bacterium]
MSSAFPRLADTTTLDQGHPAHPSDTLVMLDTNNLTTPLEVVLSAKTIDWDLLARQYGQMIKYATALRLGTTEAHQMLRRFTRSSPKHPPNTPPTRPSKSRAD